MAKKARIFASPLILGVGASIVILIGGSLGYWLIEDYPLIDALYMTAITVTTVGFGEIQPLSPAGRIFTIGLIFVGVGTVLYIISQFTQMMVEGKLRQVMGRRSLQRNIKALRGHYIICGYGRIGAQVSDMLEEEGTETVVIENREEVTRRLADQGRHYVYGSATEDETLLAAGIDRAAGIVASVGSDADNLYIVLSAKGIKPDLFVIARADEPGSERKLKRAGADKVVSPYYMGARRMAQSVLRPSVADFIDLTFHGGDMALQMEQLVVGPGTELAGVALKDSSIRAKLDLIILAIRKSDGRMIFNPGADTVIEVDDTLIALGTRVSMLKLGEMLHTPQTE